jgi:hypothetical protein
MTKYRNFYKQFEISKFRDFKISRFQNFEISKFRDFKISRFQNFKIFKSFREFKFRNSRFSLFNRNLLLLIFGKLIK